MYVKIVAEYIAIRSSLAINSEFISAIKIQQNL